MKKTMIAIVSLLLILLNILAPITSVSYAQQTPRGPWVDEVVFVEESDISKAVERLIANDIQVYFDDLTDPQLFKEVREKLSYDISYGLFYEISFNPVGPEFPNPQVQGVIFNPFSNPRIREAVNYIIDRNYIINEILGGLAVPRLTVLTPSFPDYARYADVVAQLEEEYRYNFEKGRDIIYEEMIKMGAEMREGKWYYKGQPVKLIFLIRTEDARKPIGDYVAGQLEKVGFVVEKKYGRSAELAPLWLRGDPKEGRWHLYTGGWISTVISRDESDNFGLYYTKLGRPELLWQSYVNDPEFYVVAERLWNKDFASMEERDELMRKALVLSLKESQRVWLVNLVSVWPKRPEVSISADLSGGYSGSWLWPYTLRYTGKVGGTVKIGIPSILTQPWNPIGGSNWIFDQSLIRATGEQAVIPDPYTGLYHALRVEKAEVYLSKELEGQVRATLPWVKLSFVEKIEVPEDAWYRFDSTTNKLETVPKGTTSTVKVVVHYQKDLFKNYKWHDGSPFSIADLVYNFLLTFDRANPNSPLYDKSYVPTFDAWFKMFRGFRIVSQDPLVIEYYTDTWYMDAEWIAASAANVFWPYYSQGPGAWHLVAVTARAESEGKVAFTSSKAETLKVEWANLLAGPSLKLIAETLDKCIQDGFIPYEPVLGKYLTKQEAVARYQNLKSWYQKFGHLWVGNGPFYIKSVDVVAKIITLGANREYIDLADRWSIFEAPPIPEVKITPPDAVYPGAKAEFVISVTTRGQPYKSEYIDFVKFVIKHAEGSLSGYAKCVADGKCVIELDGTQTSLMAPGPADVTVIAVSKLVGKPTIEKTTFRISTLVDYLALQLAKTEGDIKASLSKVETGMNNKLNEIKDQVEEVRSGLSSLRGLTYGALGLAIIALLLNVVFFVKRPK